MRYPVNYICLTNEHHYGKNLDFGWDNNQGGSNIPIFSCDNGIIESVYYDESGGNTIFIDHENGILSGYRHLSSINVSVGQKVSIGQKIGNMGNTGTNTTGNHLHFGLYEKAASDRDYSTIDPFEYLKVYNDQVVCNNTKVNYGNKIKYYNSSINLPENILYYKYIYNVDDEGLNVRNTPNGSLIDNIPFGKKVAIYEEDGNWSRIGTNRWIYNAYTSFTFPQCYKVISNDGLNVRNKPSNNSTILRLMPKGTIVGIFKKSGTWVKISPTEEFWCSMNYLEKILTEF